MRKAGVPKDAVARLYREALGLKEGSRNDAVEMRVGNRLLAATVGTLVYGADVPPRMTPRRVGRKAAVACVSDLAAKGVRPRWALVSVTAPESCAPRTHKGVASGLADAAATYGFVVLGGDTSRGEEMSITVCMMGMARGIFRRHGGHAYQRRQPSVPGRGGASPGDHVFATGRFGLPAAGLYAMRHGVPGPRGCIRAALEPRARLDFGARAARYLSSTMNSGNGLSATLNEMAARSGVRIVVDGDPAADGVPEFAARHGLDADDLVYNGGGEYEMVFTLRPGGIDDIFSAVRDTDISLAFLGRVEEGGGVYLERDGGRAPLPAGGRKALR